MAAPDWLITEPDAFEDYDLGPLKGGKEAEIFVIERVCGERFCLLAHKRYRPRMVSTKGELQALDFQRPAAFVNDHAYRAGRRIPDSRARRAVERKTRFGRFICDDIMLSNSGVETSRPSQATKSRWAPRGLTAQSSSNSLRFVTPMKLRRFRTDPSGSGTPFATSLSNL